MKGKTHQTGVKQEIPRSCIFLTQKKGIISRPISTREYERNKEVKWIGGYEKGRVINP